MKNKLTVGLFLILGFASFPRAASADLLTFTGTSINTGLSARADFTLLNSTTLKIVLTNTSTTVPSHLAGDAASDQLLTLLAFQLPGTTSITGGTGTISPGSTGPNGKEWGYGSDGSGQCCDAADPTRTYDDWISTLSAGPQQFSNGSLDGPGLDGSKYGIAPNPTFGTPLSSIRNSATFTLSLSGPVPDLSFLMNGAVVESGSDAAFLTTGNAGALQLGAIALLGMGLLGWAGHRLTSRRA